MEHIKRIKINLSRPNMPIKIHAKQHDADTRVIIAELYADETPYTPTGTFTGIVNVAKPDGTGCYYDVDSVIGNEVTFTLVEQALTAAGTANIEVSLLTNNDERLTSFKFQLEIEARVLDDSTIVSSDYFNALISASSSLMVDLSEIQEKLGTIETGAEVNAIDTIKRNGTALTITNKAVDVSVPTKISDLTNDSGFQTSSDVTTAINSAISGISGISFEVVQTLPSSGTSGTIYLLSNSGSGTNIYDEYIYYNSAWEKIGTTDIDLTNYVTDANYVHTDNNYTSSEKTKLSNIEYGAEVNQDAFKYVKVGSSTITADSVADTLEIVAGSNITLTADVSNDKLTIAATDTTYSAATTSADGLMSASDKTKLNGISSGAQANVIEEVQVNGTALTPSNKAVNVTVPTKTSDLLNDSGFGSSASPKYGTCSTAAATAAKVITLEDSTGWELKAGSIICVSFSYTNTADDPTFNVNNSGAKYVYYRNSVISTGSLAFAGYVTSPMLYMYSGTYWIWIGWSIAYTNMSNAEATAGTSTSGHAVSAAVMKAAIETFAYIKPSGGIPKTDLASAVQTSLGNADTAYQKPGTGIPKTDLASAVQTSLGNADTVYAFVNSTLYNNAGAHNSIYRGESLGTSVSAEQWSAISAGTFDNMYIGDYWTIDSVVWRIAAFDYWLGYGSTTCADHHVVIVPDSVLVTGTKMNSTNITTGAYTNSDFRKGTNSNTGRSQCETKINGAFGAAHILSHKEYFANAVTNGYESAVAEADGTVELLSEQMVFGCRMFSSSVNGTSLPALQTYDHTQLPLFALNHSHICINAFWFLRDVVSSTQFAQVHKNGYCFYNTATNTNIGFRPMFAIYQAASS